MTDLAHHQRAMLKLMRGGQLGPSEGDPHLHQVAASRHLAEARRVVLLWRVHMLEQGCALTMALLRSRRTLGPTLQEFVDNHNLSPFRESQAHAFLEWLSASDDLLLRAVSGFEKTLVAVRNGDASMHEVAWPVDPHPVLQALARGEPVDEPLPQVAWIARVHHALPGGFVLMPAQQPQGRRT